MCWAVTSRSPGGRSADSVDFLAGVERGLAGQLLVLLLLVADGDQQDDVEDPVAEVAEEPQRPADPVGNGVDRADDEHGEDGHGEKSPAGSRGFDRRRHQRFQLLCGLISMRSSFVTFVSSAVALLSRVPIRPDRAVACAVTAGAAVLPRRAGGAELVLSPASCWRRELISSGLTELPDADSWLSRVSSAARRVFSACSWLICSSTSCSRCSGS